MLDETGIQSIPSWEPYILPTESISALLSALDKIRIVINPGGGMGSQKASFTLMRKLRSLGFEGVFDICYYELANCPDNLHTFAADFEPKTTEDQNFIHAELGELYFRRLPYQEIAHDLPFVELAFTAAEHQIDSIVKTSDSFKAAQYHCANYVTLNPSGWPNADTPKQIELFTLNQIHPLSPDARLKDIHTTAKFDKKLIPQVLLGHLLDQVVTAQEKNTLKFALIYGLDHGRGWLAAEDELARIAAATRQAKIGKPVLLIVPYSKTMIYDRARLNSCAEFYDTHNLEALLHRLNTDTLPADTVSILLTERLPETCFDALAKESFFTVAEGCNLIELMEAAQHPYLHGGRNLTELLQTSASGAAPLSAPEMCRIQQDANAHLTNASYTDADALVKWLMLLNARDPDFLAYLQERHQLYLHKPDAVEEALTVLLNAQPDCSPAAFIHHLFDDLNKHLQMKTTIDLDAPEITVLLSRLHLLMPRYEKKLALTESFFHLISKCIGLIKNLILTPDDPLEDLLVYFRKFSLPAPLHKPKLPADQRRQFTEKTAKFLAAYVSDDTARRQFFDMAIAEFEKALGQSAQATPSSPQSPAVTYYVDAETAAGLPPTLDPYHASGKYRKVTPAAKGM